MKNDALMHREGLKGWCRPRTERNLSSGKLAFAKLSILIQHADTSQTIFVGQFPIVSDRIRSVSQQTRHVDPMFFYCWADVADGEPTLKQHWINVSCLMGWGRYYSWIPTNQAFIKENDNSLSPIEACSSPPPYSKFKICYVSRQIFCHFKAPSLSAKSDTLLWSPP